MAESDRCVVCDVMFAIPAAIACAEVGDVDEARHHLEVAQHSAQRFDRVAWEAAVHEAQAHLALAEGDHEAAQAHLDSAARLFSTAGHERDAARCRDSLAIAS